jgi:hypothetical protein
MFCRSPVLDLSVTLFIISYNHQWPYMTDILDPKMHGYFKLGFVKLYKFNVMVFSKKEKKN